VLRVARVLSVLLAVVLASCVSTPPPAPAASSSPKGQPAGTAAAPSGAAAESLARMREFLKTGGARVDEGLLADGIKQLVAVLAERQQVAPSKEADDLAAAAEKRLSGLSSSLALEPDTGWLDAANNQVTGQTLDFRKLMPSVILTIKQSGGRSLVSNAPIQFAFVKGGGVITGTVNTNDFGQANCVIASFENASAEQVVRASLVVKVGAFAYAFKGVERDFVFAPPQRRASLLVLERSPLGVASDPFIADPVYQTLKGIRYDFSFFNGSISPQAFSRVYEGDLTSINALGLDKDVSYVIVLLNDCTGIRQLELNGQKFNLFVSDARATLRVVRKADGKVMYQAAVERAQAKGNHGQGGTQEKAAQDVLRNTAADLAAAVKKDIAVISTALTGQ
jgi:hypothetical protein